MYSFNSLQSSFRLGPRMHLILTALHRLEKGARRRSVTYLNKGLILSSLILPPP